MRTAFINALIMKCRWYGDKINVISKTTVSYAMPSNKRGEPCAFFVSRGSVGFVERWSLTRLNWLFAETAAAAIASRFFRVGMNLSEENEILLRTFLLGKDRDGWVASRMHVRGG